jgi:hypothetical protein
MKNTRIFPMRRLPGPADSPLCEGVHTPEAHVELFRGWQRTQTQSSVRTLRSLRQQMDVWFCLMQESSAERHCCVTADPDQTHCAPSGARPEILCFSLDFDLHRCGQFGSNSENVQPVKARLKGNTIRPPKELLKSLVLKRAEWCPKQSRRVRFDLQCDCVFAHSYTCR